MYENAFNDVFQSTLPHGSDGSPFTQITNGAVISIHAPSRERPLTKPIFGIKELFQSTLPHGSDILVVDAQDKEALFQSTLPHGSDKLISAFMIGLREFQSTLPHGSDSIEIIM